MTKQTLHIAQKLRYSRYSFSPLYEVLKEISARDEIVSVWVYGGKSSAKTFSISQFLLNRAIHEEYSSVAFRKEQTTIKRSIKESFKAALKSMSISKAFEVMDFSFRSKINNSLITLLGLNDPEKIKGVEGVNYLYFDELNQFEKEEYDQAEGSLRGKTNQIVFGSWNPVSEQSWIKTDYIDKIKWIDLNTKTKLPSPDSFIRISEDGTRVLIKTDYRDNYFTVGHPDGVHGFVDAKLIAKYEAKRDQDPQWYRVNVLGEWGVIEPDRKYWDKFGPDNIKPAHECLFNERLPIYASFDFNAERISVTVAQRPEYFGFVFIWEFYDEVCDLEACVAEVCRRFGSSTYVYVTGDASGNNRSAFSTGKARAYDMIIAAFRQGGMVPELTLPGANPPTDGRRIQNNEALHYHHVYFSSAMGNTINDVRAVPALPTGKIDKSDSKIGHLLDSASYMIYNFGPHLTYENATRNI